MVRTVDGTLITQPSQFSNDVPFIANIVIERKDENARFYGRPIKAREILSSTGSTFNIPAGVEPLYRAIEVAEVGPDTPVMREVNPFSDNHHSPSADATVVEYDAPRGLSAPQTEVGPALERVETLPEYRYSEQEDDLYVVSEEQRPFLSEKTVAAPQHNESQRVEETRVAEATTEAEGEREGSERRDRASFLLTARYLV